MKQVLTFALAMWMTCLAWGSSTTPSPVADEPKVQQVFQHTDAQPMTVGTLEGDDEPFQTWRGQVSGKPVYVEVHGDALRLQVGRRTFVRMLSRAARSAGTPAMALDTRGTTLFATSGSQPSTAILCLESLPASVSRSTLDKAVFVILDLRGAPKVYQLPPLQAACAGLRATAPGRYEVPVWEPSPDAAEGYRVKGHRAVRSLGAMGIDGAHSSLPKEVSEFLLNREACDHFRGEVIEPPDAELKKERNDNIRTHCTGTDAALARLRQKYAKRKDVVQALRGFEARIEASPR
jgi:hypothetical protein